MCYGFSHFFSFLHHFVLEKLATSIRRVKSRLLLLCYVIHASLPCHARVLHCIVVSSFAGARARAARAAGGLRGSTWTSYPDL